MSRLFNVIPILKIINIPKTFIIFRMVNINIILYANTLAYHKTM